ncbi:MAG: hypothetical protein JNL82_04275 [Myxococcales bacterium]|nr:hypothetical protein [Myxococcales bacterium]
MQHRGLPYLSLVLLAAACGPSDSNLTTGVSETTTFGDSSSSGGDEPDPTTSGDSTGPVGTSEGGSTGPVDPSTSSSTGPDPGTTGGADECMASGECMGGYCWADFVPETMMPGTFTCHDVCVDNMGEPGNAEDVWCIDDASCCDMGASCNDMGYCVPAPAMTTGDTDTDTDTEGTGSTGDTEGTGTDTDTDTDTDTGGGVLPILGVTGLSVFANCQPAVPPDPVTAKWTLTVDNTAGDVEANLIVTKATLTYEPGMGEFVQQINADPTAIGPVPKNGKSMAMMEKTGAVDNLPNDCGRCGKDVALELTVDVDGTEAKVGATAMMGCAF